MALAAVPDGYTYLELDHVDSTNAEARRLAESGAPAPVWVLAHEQTAGRGRRGREWLSPRGNLYCSVLIYPETDSSRHAEMSFLAALAVGETLDYLSASRLDWGLKWPNDVLAGGYKISGILLESACQPRDGRDGVIAGVGINLANEPIVENYPVTTLSAESGLVVNPVAALEALSARFDIWYRVWSTQGFAPLRAAWEAHCAHMDGQVMVRTGADEFSGRFLGLTENGAARVQRDNGTVQEILAGDIFPLDDETEA